MIGSQAAQLQNLLSNNMDLLPFEEDTQGELVDYEEDPSEILPAKQQDTERQKEPQKTPSKSKSSKPEKDRKPISWKAWKGPDSEESPQHEELGSKGKGRSGEGEKAKHGEREISRARGKEDRASHRRSPPLHSRRQITRKHSPPPRGRSPGPRRRSSPFFASRHRDSYSPPRSSDRFARRRSPVITLRRPPPGRADYPSRAESDDYDAPGSHRRSLRDSDPYPMDFMLDRADSRQFRPPLAGMHRPPSPLPYSRYMEEPRMPVPHDPRYAMSELERLRNLEHIRRMELEIIEREKQELEMGLRPGAFAARGPFDAPYRLGDLEPSAWGYERPNMESSALHHRPASPSRYSVPKSPVSHRELISYASPERLPSAPFVQLRKSPGVEERSRKRREKAETEDSSKSKRAKSSLDKERTEHSKEGAEPKLERKRKAAVEQEAQPAAGTRGGNASVDASESKKQPKDVPMPHLKKEEPTLASKAKAERKESAAAGKDAAKSGAPLKKEPAPSSKENGKLTPNEQSQSKAVPAKSKHPDPNAKGNRQPATRESLKPSQSHSRPVASSKTVKNEATNSSAAKVQNIDKQESKPRSKEAEAKHKSKAPGKEFSKPSQRSEGAQSPQKAKDSERETSKDKNRRDEKAKSKLDPKPSRRNHEKAAAKSEDPRPPADKAKLKEGTVRHLGSQSKHKEGKAELTTHAKEHASSGSRARASGEAEKPKEAKKGDMRIKKSSSKETAREQEKRPRSTKAEDRPSLEDLPQPPPLNQAPTYARQGSLVDRPGPPLPPLPPLATSTSGMSKYLLEHDLLLEPGPAGTGNHSPSIGEQFYERHAFDLFVSEQQAGSQEPYLDGRRSQLPFESRNGDAAEPISRGQGFSNNPPLPPLPNDYADARGLPFDSRNRISSSSFPRLDQRLRLPDRNMRPEESSFPPPLPPLPPPLPHGSPPLPHGQGPPLSAPGGGFPPRLRSGLTISGPPGTGVDNRSSSAFPSLSRPQRGYDGNPRGGLSMRSSRHDDSRDQWYYMDPQGIVQGPASKAQLRIWLDQLASAKDKSRYQAFCRVNVWKEGMGHEHIELLRLLNEPFLQ